ncbi:ATP-binding protein [Neisseria sp. Ec49-e6-T10]|uniref:ATP-binding protein n=1 Tax=Neisseria sp. Ec49-e6-T10 TaxID=3140744 RepID=UPI003EB7D358
MQKHDCIELLNQLKLTAMAECWDEIVTDSVARKRSTMDILGRLLTAEQTYRHTRRIEYQINQARFPQHKSLADFDFSQSSLHQPAIGLLD